MLDACPLPSDDDVAGSIVGQNVEAFTRLIGEAANRLNESRFEKTISELLARRRAARAVFHTDMQEGATPSAEINMDRELDQVSSAVSKAAGTRKGLECESSAIRQQQSAPRRAS